MDLVGYDPLTANHSEPLAIPGQIYRWKPNAAPTPGNTNTVVEYGACYVKYVRVEDAALAAGNVVQYASADGIEVSKDRAGGSSIANTVAGVALGTITDAYYGFIQVSGVGQAALVTDGGVSAGDPLMVNVSVDGGVTETTITSTAPTVAEFKAAMGMTFGISLVADTSNTVAAGDYIIQGIM